MTLSSYLVGYLFALSIATIRHKNSNLTRMAFILPRHAHARPVQDQKRTDAPESYRSYWMPTKHRLGGLIWHISLMLVEFDMLLATILTSFEPQWAPSTGLSSKLCQSCILMTTKNELKHSTLQNQLCNDSMNLANTETTATVGARRKMHLGLPEGRGCRTCSSIVTN